MKQTILFLTLSIIFTSAFGQNKSAAEKLVSEGIAYHDKGDFDGAIAKYDMALELDKDNLLALSEKALSLVSLQKYEASISYCERAIELYPGNQLLTAVYITCGNAYDGLKKTDASIDAYDRGIKQFPKSYQLYFNKGVTLASVKKTEEAILCFQEAVRLNPKHASSHNAIARLSDVNGKKIPALLAYCRFISLEPQSKRAKENLNNLQEIMQSNVEKTGDKSVAITLSAEMLSDTTADGRLKENNFSPTEMILSMSAALDYEKKNKKKTAVKLFIGKLELVCSALIETKGDNYGFYWDYYVPYFKALKQKDYIETFAYIAFASSGDEKISKWLQSHKTELDQFFAWSDAFEWKTN